MRSAAAAILTALTLSALAGCGGGDEPAGDAQKGGSLRVGASSLPAVLDPALATDPLALQALWVVYTAPLSYRHAGGRDGAELIPGLVRELPGVSDDGLVYSFRFRAGLRYSNGTRLKASDWRRAVDRARRLRSPYAQLFSAIDEISADDHSGRVIVTLTRPDPAFQHALALPASAPVPRGTPSEELTDRLPPSIGPYRVRGIRPGERWVLGRARGFDLPELPAGNVDQVAIERSGTPAEQADAVAIGTSLDLMQELPPTAQLPEIRSKYDERYEEQVTASSLFFAIDPGAVPFGERRLRQAVSLAIDGPTLERLYAGRLEAGCNLVPAPVPGHGRLDPCPYGERDEPPDLARAADLVEQAGQEGTAVAVELAPALAAPAVSRYVISTLRKIGLAARVPANPGLAAVRLELLAPPVAHPAAFLAGFRGRTGDTDLDEGIAELLADPDTEPGDWGQVEEMLVDEAYAAPLGTRTTPAFFSDRVDVQGCAVFHPLFGVDLASLCLR